MKPNLHVSASIPSLWRNHNNEISDYDGSYQGNSTQRYDDQFTCRSKNELMQRQKEYFNSKRDRSCKTPRIESNQVAIDLANSTGSCLSYDIAIYQNDSSKNFNITYQDLIAKKEKRSGVKTGSSQTTKYVGNTI